MTSNHAPMPANTSLDANALARLRALDPDGRANVVTRVLQTYEASLGTLLVELAQAERDADWTAVERLAHTLKSSSASVGALALSECCAALERRLREGRVDGAAGDSAALRAEAARVRVAVQDMLRAR